MLTQMFKDRKRNKRVLAVICALSILVATGVFNQLMQPVITMTPDPVCGIAEHSHGDDCYGKLLSCGLEEGEEHTHTDGCYEKVLGCGIAEHSHDDSCYPEEVVEQPVVTAEPTAEPTEAPAEPTEVPAVPTEVPAVPAVASELDDNVDAAPAAEPTAEPVISEEPTEAPEDSEMPDFDSVPVVPENEDKSADETDNSQPSDNETTGEPVVEPVAPVISAATVSNEKVLVGHTVTWTFEAVDAAEIKYYITDAEGNEAAYGKLDPAATSISWLADRAGDFVVTIIASNEAGTVSSAGNVSVEAPEKLTAAVRSESASAFAGESITFNFVVSGGVDSTSAVIMIDQDGEIIAETSELTESITVEPKHMGDTVTSLTATITAVDSVGETAQAMVQIPVAVRVRETEEDWAKATRTELSGDWREDLIAVAETQLGYKESKLDFIIDDEGVAHGYTRYGQWWGNTHDEWCATFISFCMEYAEIDKADFPYNDNCNSWIRDLKKLDLYAEAKDYLPEAGDLVFFDQDDDGKSDHVGIVTKVDDDEIETIEGNSYGEVAELEYKLNDKNILGYASMLKAYEAYLADELDLDLETGVGADAEVIADTVLNAEPDADSAEVASIEAGSIVSVASAQQNLDSVWYEVSTADTTGYLPASTLSLNYEAEVDAEVNAASTATDSDVAAATRYKNSSGKYGVEVSVRFVPVDANGNERSDVNAPSTVRYYFDYADWKSGKSVKDNCSAITDVITSAEVSDIDLISMNTGERAYHADYAKINVSGYLLAGETSSSATQAITGTSYYYYLEVYYIPAEMTVTFQNDAGETVGTASGVRGATVAVPAIEGYAFNTQNEGKYLTGWKTSDGAVYGTAIENIQSNLTLTPVWSEATLASHTITFNYNGSTAQVSAFDGQKFGEVIAPDASKDDYRFDGWFTAEDDSGVEYAASTVITGSVALYAHYTEYIDVSFVINNSSYTNDSGYTHVTVDAEYKDAFNTNGLSYALVGTGDRYRVSGTGTLLTFTIPAGESLSDNGLKTTIVNVENQVESGGTSNNTYTYVSSYSWLNADNKVCGSNTVFTEDTTLYLRLYANNELYFLNFVCCANCSRSITAVLSDNGVSISNPGFAVGESVDGSYFPVASDVNAYFTCDSCTACGRNSNSPKVLDYWYVINKSTNAQVKFTGGMKIEDTYIASDAGNSLTVYAAWKDAPSNVSVTFRNPNGAEIKSDSEVTMYAPLSEIKPADPALDGCTFVGWTIDGANIVADNYVITADVTFTAVYDAAITVQIPDLANGNLETYTTINTMTVRTGSSLSADQITAPAFSEGYLLSGWLFEDIYGTSQSYDKVPFYSDYTVASAMNFKAQYQQAVTLTFQYRTNEMPEGEYAVAAKYYVKQNGTLYDAIDENGNAVNGATPTVSVEGYQFLGWTKSNGAGFSSMESFNADTTFTASLTKTHYIVTLQTLNFTTGVYETTNTLYVPVDSALSAAVDAEDNVVGLQDAAGDETHIFSVWTKLDGTNVDANTILAEDTVLQAQYLSNDVKVTFVDGENDTTLEVNLKRGDMLGDKLPANPVEPANKLFQGWADANGNLATAETVIEADITFTAKYIDAVNVTFMNGEEIVSTVKLYLGAELGQNIPTVSGFDAIFFQKWVDATGAEAAATNKILTDTTYTAQIDDYHVVAFNYELGEDITVDENGNEIDSGIAYYMVELAVKAGDPLSEAKDIDGKTVGIPTVLDDDIAFAGWFDAENNKAEPDTVVECDTDFYAQYKTVEVTFNYNSIAYTYTVIVGTEFADVVADAMADETYPLPDLYTTNPNFRGWGFINNGEGVVIADTQIITAEYLATFQGGIVPIIVEPAPLENYTVTLHDVQPGDTADTAKITTATVPAGATFASVIDGAKMADGRSAAEVINWYTLDNGVRTKYDPATALSSNLDLYTYTYQIVLSLSDVSAATFSTASSAAEKTADVDPSLTAGDLKRTASILDFLMPKAYAAQVVVNGNTLTVTFADGEKLSYADFVKDGIDYTMYNWQFTQIPEGSGITSIDTLIDYANNSMKPGDKIEASGTAPSYTTTSHSLEFYALIDDAWSLFKTETLQVYELSTGSYYLSAVQLEHVFADLGFKASNIRYGSTNYTPFAFREYKDQPSQDVWMYSAEYSWSNNAAFARINYYTDPCAYRIYYMPAGPDTYWGYVYQSSWSQFDVDANRFYSVTIKGQDKAFAYVPKNGTLVLEAQDGNVWKLAEGYENSCTLAADGLTISKATGPIVVEPEGEATYSITVVDADNIVYTAAECAAFTQTVMPGESPSITLSTVQKQPVEGVTITWKVYNVNGTEVTGFTPTTDETAGTVTFTFDSVNQSYVLKPEVTIPEGVYEVTYDVNTTGASFSDYSPKPSFSGESTFSELADTNVAEGETFSYLVKSPSPTYYFRTNGKYLTHYWITGWTVNGDPNTVIPIGTVLTAEQLIGYADDEDKIELKAVWSNVANSYGTAPVVDFYVALDCSTQVMDEDAVNVPTENFTSSVYSALVVNKNGELINASNTSDRLHYGRNDVSTKAIDTTLRNMVTTPITSNGTDYYLTGFPNDEYVFAQIRDLQKGWIAEYEAAKANNSSLTPKAYTSKDGAYKQKLIYIGDNYVPVDDLTSENFEIRWNVFKDTDDGYHIDGLLMQKIARVTIVKTFAGDQDAINAVKNGYSITVDNQTGSEDTKSLLLQSEDTVRDTKSIGYTSVSADGNTYTWVITGTRNHVYKVLENNYIVHEYDGFDTYNSSATYAITNSSEATGGYRVYTDNGVIVTAYSYPEDYEYKSYQTLTMRNVYTKADTLTIRKIDSVTNEGIGGVSYTLKDSDGNPVGLYRNDDGLYSTDSGDQEYGYTTATEMITDDQGYIHVKLGEGSFILEETEPTGYQEAQKLLVNVVVKDGVVQFGEVKAFDENVQLESGLVDAQTATLTIKNVSRTTSVTAKKIWADGTNLPVVVQLVRNGVPMQGDAYTVTLDAPTWSYTWDDLPLFTDGTAAIYTLQEKKIGDTNASTTADTDGFADYSVSYSTSMIYYKNGTRVPAAVWQEDGVTHYADNAEISVTNITDYGNLTFYKTDDMGAFLEGATFTLYSENKPIANATSNANGVVTFPALTPGSYLLMKETGTPAGYSDNDTSYEVVVTGVRTLIYELDANGNRVKVDGVEKPITSIKNYPSSADVQVKKVDGSGKALDGATFQIKDANGLPYMINGTNNSTFSAYNGITLQDLPVGTYTITEISAPAGYYGINGEISFSIVNGALEVDKDTLPKGVAFTGDGTEAFPYTFTVTNTPGTELPSTGGAGTTLYTIGGLLLMAASLLYGIGLRRKRERGEAI